VRAGVLTLVTTVQECRRRRYLSQRELAQAAGISPSAVAQIETGHHSPHPRTRRKIAEALGISPDDIEWPEPQPGASGDDASDA